MNRVISGWATFCFTKNTTKERICRIHVSEWSKSQNSSMHCCHKCMATTQRISDPVSLPWLMAYWEGKLLEIGYPRGMTCQNLRLAIQVSQRVMIREQYELPMNQVMTPMLNSLNYSMELDVISTITASSLRKFLTIKSHRRPFWLSTASMPSLNAS